MVTDTNHLGDYEPGSDGSLIVDEAGLEEGFAQIPNAVLRNPAISPAARVLYGILLSYAWQSDRCWPGSVTLSHDLGQSERSVTRMIRELESVGLVTSKRRGLGLSNLYMLRLRLSNQDRTLMSDTEQTPMSDTEQTPMSAEEYPLKNTKTKTPYSPPIAPTAVGALEEASPSGSSDRFRRRLPEEIAAWESAAFAAFWEAFGKTGSVVAAAKAWDKIKPDQALFSEMAIALNQQRDLYRWGQPDGRLQPDLSTWLNQMRWIDQPQPQARRRR